MSEYDFESNPRAWTFTGEVKKVKTKIYGILFNSDRIDYQLVFEKGDLRIGVIFADGRCQISDPPAGE